MNPPGYLALCKLAKRVGLDLEPFQREIARLALDPTIRELLVLIPRGNGKSALVALLTLFHLLSTPRPEAVLGAASRDQASVLFRYICQYAEAVEDDLLAVRHLQLRTPDGGTLKVLPSRGLRAHGWTPTWAVADEVHAWPDATLLDALTTSLVKRPDSKLIAISSAGQGDDSPLGRLRKRALSLPSVERDGALIRCRGERMAAMLWELPDDADLADSRILKSVNPARWITAADLQAQREAVPDIAFRRYHAGQWTAREGSWLPPGAWQSAVGEPVIEPGERIWAALDVGGTESATALCWVSEAGHVGCWIETAEDAILRAIEKVRELRGTYELVELAADPWRAKQAQLELEREGVRCIELPQTAARMVPASAALRSAIVEGRLVLPPDPELARHASNAVAEHSRRGWRIASPARGVQVDGMIALAMAVERMERKPEPVRLVGWV